MSYSLNVGSRARSEMVNVTAQVQQLVQDSGVTTGLCVVYCPHTTAGVTINEQADPSVTEDLLEQLERLVPPGKHYRHTEGNADSHVKASLMGAAATIPVAGGCLDLGTWQGIFLCEFDGPRQRRLQVQVLG